MRILFSGTPGFGHLLPLLPLAMAARRAGHAAALLTSGTMAAAVSPLRVLPAGPTPDVQMAEFTRRSGGANVRVAAPAPALAAEFFAATRVDLGADEARAAAQDYAPDVIIAEVVDFIGPLVAAALAVPWAAHAFGSALPAPLIRAFDEAVVPRFAERGLTPTARLA